ncbi:amino acid transporter-like protein [Emericellopsis cladophorae]|uniref:Amino acid transporter-like protein n=1 Tax=Emericellopsis cladophorae TaxID=2686198 RepID=A0A9P9XXA9_9HYPO|nr:amino acid transporter-like protein [Emericellopsis cladophorae]KAI6779425.1 amino acid transporter-like protein [Emericellopsis cladophorae]
MPPHPDPSRQPLLADAPQDGESVAAPPSKTFTPTFGAAAAYGILVSIVIGSGVFTSPGAIDTNVPSPGMALVMWLTGGLLAWAGANTLAELGTAIHGEGGVQPYLQYIYGDLAGFLAAWTWIMAVMPATIAILSIVFVESIYSALGVTDRADTLAHKGLSVLVLVVVSLANSISTRVSTHLSRFFLGTKFTSILLVVVAGLAVVVLQTSQPGRTDIGGRDWFVRSWFAYRDTVHPDGHRTVWQDVGAWEMLGHCSTAIYGALWAYSGWDKAIYISSELKDPSRQLPLTINTAIPTIVLCFFVANAAYYILLPWDVVSTSDSVAVTAISRLLGVRFGILAAVLICLVVAGSILGNSLVVGRMTVAAANKGWFPRLFTVIGRVGLPKDRRSSPDTPSSSSTAFDAPVNAVLLSMALSALYILFGDFRSLLTFNGLGEYTFFFLTVLGAIILRWREPDLTRPYKPLLIIPVVFALVSGFVIVRGAAFAPVQALVLVVLWAIGLVVYWVKMRWFAS